MILQTYNPSHFSITTARDQDYDEFFRQEIEFRKVLGYPPFTRMVQIRMTGPDAQRLAAFAERLGETGRQMLAERPVDARVEIMGPIEAPLHRIANQFRWQMLLKGPAVVPLHRFVRELLAHKEVQANRGRIHVGVDVDPVFLM